jgi:hypothetical protein
MITRRGLHRIFRVYCSWIAAALARGLPSSFRVGINQLPKVERESEHLEECMAISSGPVRPLTDEEVQAVVTTIAGGDTPEAEYLFDDLIGLANAASSSEAAETLRLVALLFTRSVARMGRMRPSEAECIDFEQLSEEEVEVLRLLLPKLQHDEAIARVADVLWLRTGNWNFANQSVESYLRLAEAIADDDHWPRCFDRFERAVVLAASLNRGSDLFLRCITSVEETIAHRNGEDSSFLSAKLMELLIAQKVRDRGLEFAPLAEKAAHLAEEQREFTRAQRYWMTAARWYALLGKRECELSARSSHAESFAKEAHWRGNDSLGRGAAAHILQGAINHYRRLPNSKERIRDLLIELKAYESGAGDELKSIGTSIDVSDLMRHAREVVTGKPLPDALRAFAALTRSASVERLRKDVIKFAKKFAMSHMFPEFVLSREGAMIAARGGVNPKSADDDSEAVRARMMEHACTLHRLTVLGEIEPARRQIIAEHTIREEDLFPLLHASNFVPPGREDIYAKALYAGFASNFDVAIHLLLPQIEHSIRWMLQRRKVPTVAFRPNGFQVEKDLGTLLLNEPETKELMPADLHFDLVTTLVHPFGWNLRNEIAHGIVPSQEFQSVPVIYCWWLVLRICYLALPAPPDEPANTRSEPPAPPQPTDGNAAPADGSI